MVVKQFTLHLHHKILLLPIFPVQLYNGPVTFLLEQAHRLVMAQLVMVLLYRTDQAMAQMDKKV